MSKGKNVFGCIVKQSTFGKVRIGNSHAFPTTNPLFFVQFFYFQAAQNVPIKGNSTLCFFVGCSTVFETEFGEPKHLDAQ